MVESKGKESLNEEVEWNILWWNARGGSLNKEPNGDNCMVECRSGKFEQRNKTETIVFGA